MTCESCDWPVASAGFRDDEILYYSKLYVITKSGANSAKFNPSTNQNLLSSSVRFGPKHNSKKRNSCFCEAEINMLRNVTRLRYQLAKLVVYLVNASSVSTPSHWQHLLIPYQIHMLDPYWWNARRGNTRATLYCNCVQASHVWSGWSALDHSHWFPLSTVFQCGCRYRWPWLSQTCWSLLSYQG